MDTTYHLHVEISVLSISHIFRFAKKTMKAIYNLTRHFQQNEREILKCQTYVTEKMYGWMDIYSSCPIAWCWFKPIQGDSHHSRHALRRYASLAYHERLVQNERFLFAFNEVNRLFQRRILTWVDYSIQGETFSADLRQHDTCHCTSPQHLVVGAARN